MLPFIILVILGVKKGYARFHADRGEISNEGQGKQ